MQKSFTELYKEQTAKPSPAQVFITEMAELTRRKPWTVRGWTSGRTYPSPLEQETIAEHFGIPVHVLFPPRDKKKGAKK